MNKSVSNKTKILLVYDKQCPACNNYCQWIRIRDSVGELQLVNARDDAAVLNEITAKGWDIDQGMVLKLEEQIYYGADAIHALALISSNSGWFNRFNYWLFKHPTRAKLLYPILRCCRNILLKILGVSKINNLNISGNEKF